MQQRPAPAAGWLQAVQPLPALPVAAARAEGGGAVLALRHPQGRPRPRSRSARPGSARDSAVPPPSAVNSSWTAEEETTGLGFSSIHKNVLLSLPNACVSHPKQNPALLAKLCWSGRCGHGARRGLGAGSPPWLVPRQWQEGGGGEGLCCAHPSKAWAEPRARDALLLGAGRVPCSSPRQQPHRDGTEQGLGAGPGFSRGSVGHPASSPWARTRGCVLGGCETVWGSSRLWLLQGMGMQTEGGGCQAPPVPVWHRWGEGSCPQGLELPAFWLPVLLAPQELLAEAHGGHPPADSPVVQDSVPALHRALLAGPWVCRHRRPAVPGHQ